MNDDPRAYRPAVVVTGIGVKTPAGNDLATCWSTLLAGRSVIAPIARFDPSGLPVRFAGEVRDFDPVAYLGQKESRHTDRTTQLGFAAAVDALTDSAPGVSDPGRCAVVAGTGMGGVASVYAQSLTFAERGPDRLSPYAITMIMPNATAALIAVRLGWTGPNLCLATACTSASNAIGEGARLIREGSADVVLAGGTEAAVNPVGIAAFARMGALSTRHDEPARASRPFDRLRDGFVLAEGAAFVVLEPYDRAVARGARVYGEIRGYGRNSDAFDIAAPSAGGVGAISCMRLALRDADVDPSEISHINAHGTATRLNDLTEAEAIGKVFGADPPPVTSTKGVTGHLIGAAGAVQVVASLLSLRYGVVPPTANFERPDANILIDVVGQSPRPNGPGPVLTNTFGFGGHNACLVLARAERPRVEPPGRPSGTVAARPRET
jgi:3-oxoacyl-[acyl-carrier-protein] synthase II